MSARDDLVDEIAGHPIGSGYYSTSVGIDEAREIADAILAAGYSKPRTISTVEELDSLPVESIVMERGNAKFCLASPAIWLCFDPNEPYTSADIALPATVLYTPKES